MQINGEDPKPRRPEDAEVIIHFITANCRFCGEPVPKDTKCWWVREQPDCKGGIYHTDCLA